MKKSINITWTDKRGNSVEFQYITPGKFVQSYRVLLNGKLAGHLSGSMKPDQAQAEWFIRRHAQRIKEDEQRMSAAA